MALKSCVQSICLRSAFLVAWRPHSLNLEGLKEGALKMIDGRSVGEFPTAAAGNRRCDTTCLRWG
jgi:hypothetical protein